MARARDIARRIPRPRHATVVAYLALFVAIGVTAAIAVPPDSVDSNAIINGEVRKPDIHNGAVNSDKVANDSLTGQDINESSLGTVPNASKLGGESPSVFRNPVIGFGLRLKPRTLPATLEIRPDQTQRRVRTSCQVGLALRSIGQDGFASCGGPAVYHTYLPDTGILCKADCTEGTLTLPAGSYAVSAKIEIFHPSIFDDNNADHLTKVTCHLDAGGDSTSAQFRVDDNGRKPPLPNNHSYDPSTSATLAMQLVHTFGANGGRTAVVCRDFDQGDVRAGGLRITAIGYS